MVHPKKPWTYTQLRYPLKLQGIRILSSFDALKWRGIFVIFLCGGGFLEKKPILELNVLKQHYLEPETSVKKCFFHHVHPFKTGCLGYQVEIDDIYKFHLIRFQISTHQTDSQKEMRWKDICSTWMGDFFFNKEQLSRLLISEPEGLMLQNLKAYNFWVVFLSGQTSGTNKQWASLKSHCSAGISPVPQHLKHSRWFRLFLDGFEKHIWFFGTKFSEMLTMNY